MGQELKLRRAEGRRGALVAKSRGLPPQKARLVAHGNAVTRERGEARRRLRHVRERSCGDGECASCWQTF
eukprot:3766405-Pleurochrysis_carterae.AAC.1